MITVIALRSETMKADKESKNNPCDLLSLDKNSLSSGRNVLKLSIGRINCLWN